MAYMLIFLLKEKLQMFLAKIPVNKILRLLDNLTLWPLTSLLSQQRFEQLGTDF